MMKLNRELAKEAIREAYIRDIEYGTVRDEIVFEYDGEYAPIIPVKRGVIVARTGAGKTNAFENVAGTLILVPRVIQTSVFTGENTDYLIQTILDRGAMITFDKFYGHYRMSDEFRGLIDGKKIQIVVDEAHLLVSIPSRKSKLIYGLDAVFLSGTIEKFFRPDLQRYKYKPPSPQKIYYTNGMLPKINGSLIFLDNAKALMQKYKDQCVVGAQHKFENVNIHTTNLNTVYATSALREGISIKNKNFKACMCWMQSCQLWSVKDLIQGLFRVRGNAIIRVVSKKPPNGYSKRVDVEWWTKRAKDLSSTREMNAIFGEYYSKIVKYTQKTSKYEEVTEYGIVCYLADLTKHNYDPDFYEFLEYDGETEITIDTKIEASVDEVEIVSHTMEDGTIWNYPKKKEKDFRMWSEQYETGLITKIGKLKEWRGLQYLYTNTRISKHIKEMYNKQNKWRGERYSIDMFLSLLRDLAKVEMRYEDGIIERVSTHTDIKKIEIRVVSIIPFEWLVCA